MRAFVGLPVPEAWIAPLGRAQARIPFGRAVPAGDLHATLAFLGEQPEQRLEALHELLEARALPGACLRPRAFAVLGSGRPRALALDLEPDSALARLRDGVRSAARMAGIDLPRERFRPHVTLVRFPAAARGDPSRLPGLLARIGPPDLAPAPGAGVVLWSSVLRPEGPDYAPIGAYPTSAA